MTIPMETTTPKISVIIPVYKTEDCLEKCLRSVLSGNFQEIEILLIDDGSPNGAVCDKYVYEDYRIKVTHQPKNKGPAAARNEGVKQAKGDYICFIDSDDWIIPAMLTQLHKLIVKHDADISSCGFLEYVDGKPLKPYRFDEKTAEPIEILDGMTAMQRMLLSDPQMGHAPWGKLYKRSLYQQIYYPEGCLYEDAATTYKLYRKAVRIVHTAVPYYCYAIHNRGISQRAFNAASMDKLLVAEEIVKDINLNNPALQPYAQGFHIVSALRLVADFTPQIIKEYPTEYARVDKVLTHKEYARVSHLSRRHRLLLFLYRHNKAAFSYIWRWRLERTPR